MQCCETRFFVVQVRIGSELFVSFRFRSSSVEVSSKMKTPWILVFLLRADVMKIFVPKLTPECKFIPYSFVIPTLSTKSTVGPRTSLETRPQKALKITSQRQRCY